MASPETIPSTSRVLTLPAIGQPLALVPTPLSTPTPGSALVRILTTVIRPHHRAGFQGNSPLSFPIPYTPGHTAIARVLSTGPDAVYVRPGQLVYVDALLAARDDPAGHGQAILGLHDGAAPDPKKLFNAWGGLWRDIATVPLEQCHVLNEEALTGKGYSFSDLQMIERLVLAYGATCAADLKPGQTVIVAPASGNYSGAVAEVAAQLGCHVIALTRSASRLAGLTALHPRITAVEIRDSEAETAAAVLAACPPTGADAYIDASPPVPAVSHFQPSLSAVRPHGRVVLLGMLFSVQLDYLAVMTKNISIRGQWMYTRQQVADVVRLVESGVLKLGREAGHEVLGAYALEDWEKAVEVAEGVLGWGKQILFTSPRDDRDM